MSGKTMKKSNMYEEIADRLEEMILSDEIKSDAKLPGEAALASSFGVSRPVIREALMLLNARGLISQRNGDGSYVSSPSGEDLSKMIKRMVSLENTDILSLFEARIALEVQSAALAALRASSDDVMRLRRLTAEMRSAAGDRSAFAGLDVAFHNEIASIGGNRILRIFIGSLNSQISGMIEHNLVLEGADSDAVSYHEKITEAIASGSPERASELMRNHILIFMRNAEQRRRDTRV
ncbi:MAG: FadR family transcriptional regulator [Clostridia bacterium]|nr:FadR family transcriptional regulator [Clostridia bacterium]